MADIISAIGTATGVGRNYSTLQAWEDALPASAITAGNNYIAELYNDSEFLAASPLVIAGCATDATHTLTVRAAAGQSFRDNANVRTNALRYNAANGVSIRGTSGYGVALEVQTPYVTLDGLQIAHTNNGKSVVANLGGPSNLTINNCLAEAPGSFAQTVYVSQDSVLVQNTVIVNTGGGTGLLASAGTSKVYNVTVVKIGTPSGSGISGAAQIRNSVAANFSTCFASVTPASCSNNASTDATAPGAGSLSNLTLASLFEVPGTDYRTKAGAALIDAGTAIGPATDISGTTRPQGTAYDIGAWEVAAGVGGSGATYSYTGAGGIVFSGTITKVRGATRAPTGGIQITGAAPASRGTVRTPAGGLLLAGTATQRRGRAIAPSGGLSLAGAAGLVRGAARAAAGGVQFAGAAATSFFSAVQSRVVNPVGGLLFAGAAAVGRSVRKVASGGITFSGHALMRTGPLSAILSGILPIFRRRRR